MVSKQSLIVGFLVAWIITIYLIYTRSQVDGVDDIDELTRSLRVAEAAVNALKSQNSELSRSVETLRNAKLDNLNQRVDSVNKDIDKMKSQLNNAESSKSECVRQVNELQKIIGDLREVRGQTPAGFVQGGKHGLIDIAGPGPTHEHETARFKLEDNVRELWYFTKQQLAGVSSIDQLPGLLDDWFHRHRSIQIDLERLSQADNLESWRTQEHHDLQDLMQRRIHHIQNPPDCKKAKKLLCNLNKGCGYGCQLHHVVYCFMIAYGTQRTMILESEGWRYSTRGWEGVFQPVSETCKTLPVTAQRQHWNGEKESEDIDTVVLPIVDALAMRPPYMPLSYPEDLAPRLERLTDDPSVWFVAQFVKYLMKYQPDTQKDLDLVTSKMGFTNPIVGIHVRRTDKVGTEAAFHSLTEYMEHAEQWFLVQERIEGRIDKRRVYIASDDASVINEAKTKYGKDYEIFGDADIAQSAGMSSRYSDASLRGVITDIHLLSKCDYLVCTFSSQVCRVGYEIMQTIHPNPSRWFHSLDDIYYFGGQGAHEETVIYKHDKRNREEIDIEVGDTIGIAGNHWDGNSKGNNRRTGAVGLYPSYKTVDKRVVVKYPTYPEVPLNPS